MVVNVLVYLGIERRWQHCYEKLALYWAPREGSCSCVLVLQSGDLGGFGCRLAPVF